MTPLSGTSAASAGPEGDCGSGTPTWVSASTAKWQPRLQTQGIICHTSLREAEKAKHRKRLGAAAGEARPQARHRGGEQPTSLQERAGVLGRPCAP